MKFLLVFCFFCCYNLSFSQPLIPFLQDSLYGYSDVHGTLIIEPQFDEAFLFDTTYTYAQVRMQDKYYVINRKGQRLEGVEMDCKIEFEMLHSLSANLNALRRLRKHREESTSTSNIVVIKKNFHFRDNSRVYNVFNPEKFIALQIAMIPDPTAYIRQEAYSNYVNDCLFVGLDNGMFNVYDKNLNFCFKSSKLPHFISKNEIQFINKVGCVSNIEQKLINKIPFGYVEQTKNKNRFIFCTEDNPRITRSQNNNKCGVCDKDYNIIIDSIYYSVATLDNFYLGSQKANTYVTDLINEKGKVILKEKKRIRGLKDNAVIVVTDTTGEISIYDQTLSLLKSDEFSSFTWNEYDYLFHYKKGDISGLLDSNLNIVFEYPAESLAPLGYNYTFTEGKKFGIVSGDKTVIVPNIYKYISGLHYGYIRVETFNKKYGLLTENGQIALDTIFDVIEIDTINSQVYFNTKMDRLWTAFKPSGEIIAKDKKSRYYPYSKEDLAENYAQIFHQVDMNVNESSYTNLSNFMREYEKFINPNSNLIFQIGEKKYACQTDLNYISNGKEEKVEIIKANEKNRLYSFKTNEGEGIVNFDNKVLLSAGDREIHDLADSYIVFKENDKYVLYDLNLKKLSFIHFNRVSIAYDDVPLTQVSKRVPGSSYEYVSESCITNSIDTLIGYKYRAGYIDKSGEIAIPLQYSYTTKFEKGFALVGNKDEKDVYQCYIIDTLGQVIQTFDKGIKPYNWDIDHEILQVENGDNRGYIYKNGDILIDIKYKSIHKFIGYDFRNYNPKDYNLFTVYKHDDTHYLINQKGDILYANTKMTERDHHNILPIQNDLVLVYPDDEMQVINIETGEKFIKFRGDKAELVSSVDMLLIKVYQDDHYYYVNPINNVIYNNYRE